MLNDKKLPNDYCVKFVVVAIHILNISPTKAVRNINSDEGWFHRKPNVSHLKVFGCIAYALVDENNQGKMDKKSEKCIFIGYSNESNGYRLNNPKTKKLIIRRDVIFYESSYWNWNESSMNKKVKNTSQGVNLDPFSSREPSSHDDSPPRKFCSLRDVYDSCTFVLITTEPLSYEESQDKEEWINTMKEEIDDRSNPNGVRHGNWLIYLYLVMQLELSGFIG